MELSLELCASHWSWAGTGDACEMSVFGIQHWYGLPREAVLPLPADSTGQAGGL